MQFRGALCHLVLLATAVSASQNVAQHHPVIKKAAVVHKALLGGKHTAKLGCKVAGPECDDKLTMVLEVNTVLKAADDTEKKAEEAEIEAKKLMEVASEVQAAKKEEQSEEAAEVAVVEKLKAKEEAVKNEDAEIREEKQTLEAEQQTLKQTSAVNPEAAAIVMKDEEALKEEVKAKEIGKEVKEEEAKTVKQEKLVTEMKVATSEAKVAAKVNLFKAEDKSVKRMEKQVSPKEMYQVELKVYKTQTKIVKAASKEPVDPKTATVAEMVEKAEVPKVKLATEKVATAKIEAQEAVVEKKKAEVKIEEVVHEAKVTKEVLKITKTFGSVEKLEKEIEKCQPCPVAPAVAPPVTPAVALPVCEKWDFVVVPNGDLMGVKMGPVSTKGGVKTGNKMTEVHTLGKSSNYKNWVLQTPTVLEMIGGMMEWDWAAMPNGDLMGIKMGPTTGSKKTEVHIMSKSSNYKQWVLHAATALELTTHKQWDFVAMPNGDLGCIKKGPTGSGKTEMHILSKDSQYKKFVLHAATGLELTDGATEWDFAAMPNGDLMCIKMGPETGSKMTEVHILSKSSNYAKFVLHAATGLSLTTHKEWSFGTMPNGDLMCIKKGPTTGTSKTEVHILGKSSNYKNWVLQTGTGLHLTLQPPGTCSIP